MADVERKVQTTFDIGGNAQRAVGAIGGSMRKLGGMITRITSLVSPLSVALGALGGAMSMKGIIKVGSEFEQMQIGMAQTLRFMGAGGETWRDAMQNSEAVIKRVRAAAAALPGEAEDYALALQLAGQKAKIATGNFDESFKLIKDMTAVTISMGANATLGATMINRMLNLNHGMMIRTGALSQKLMTAMQALPGYANLTTKEFNKMDLKERTKLVKQLAGQFDDMIDQSSGTWEAISGAAASSFKQIFEMASQPLFVTAKRNLDALNKALFTSTGDLTSLGKTVKDVGRNISFKIVSGILAAADAAKKLWGVFKAFTKSPVFAAISEMAQMLGDAARKVGTVVGGAAQNFGGGGADEGGGGLGEVAAVVGGLVGIMGALNPAMTLLTSGFTSFLTHTSEAKQVFAGLSEIVMMLSEAVAPLYELFLTTSAILGDFAAAVLPPLVRMAGAVVEALMPLVQTIISVVSTMMGKLRPSLNSLFKAVGVLIDALSNTLVPIVETIAEVIGWLVEKIGDYLMPVIQTYIDTLTIVVNALAAFTAALGSATSAAAAEGGGGGMPMIKQQSMFPISVAATPAVAQGGVGAGGVGGGAGGGARGGGGRATNDFRFSRFEISQKFAEGFDPDRIAVAFSQDLSKIGEQRMQSGFEPLYAVR